MSSKPKGKGGRKPFTSDSLAKPVEAASYADFIAVHSSNKQFLLEFGQTQPNIKEPIMVSKVMLHPKTAGDLVAVLLSQVSKYQERNKEDILPAGLKMTPIKKEDIH